MPIEGYVDNTDMRKLLLLTVIYALIACSGPVRKAEVIPEPLTGKSVRHLIIEANKHIGEPYRYGGTNSRGWDCSGFVRAIYARSLSMQLPRSSEEMHALGVEIPLSKGKAGDLVFFNINTKKPSHVGIYLGDRNFVHVSTSQGVVVSSLEEEYYRKHFLGLRRLPFGKIAIAK
jgi:cell wall-associated NlpC family hydrolase